VSNIRWSRHCGDYGRADWPAWSPDGESIAFFASAPQTEGSAFDRVNLPWSLFVMSADALEPRGELDQADLAIPYVDGLEHGVVEASSHGGSCLQICGVAVAGEPDRGPEHVLPAFEVALGRLELVLGRMLGDGDAVLLWAEGAVTRVDQATGSVADERIVVPGRPDVAVASGDLWATSSADGTLLRIDASTGDVLDVVRVGEGGPSPIQFSVEAGDGFVWMLGGFEVEMLQVDPSAGELVNHFAVDPSAVDVSVGRGSLWLASLGDSIIELEE
jgi:hypothetical protein